MCDFHTELHVEQACSRARAGSQLPTRSCRTRGSIANSPAVTSGMSGSGSDSLVARAAGGKSGRDHSAGVPGLGQHAKRRIGSSITIVSARPKILAGHFHATRDRGAATDGPILVLHDTTEFSFKREDIDAVGITRKAVADTYRDGTPRHYTTCGILMHSSLAVTTEGLPLD